MMPRVRPTNDLEPDQGVSLIEMLVVLAIVAIAYVIAVPSVRGSARGLETRAFAHDLVSHLRAARASAISRGRSVGVSIDVAHRQYTTETDGRVTKLPDDLVLTVTSARQMSREQGVARLLFFPDGSSSGGRIELQRGSQRLAVAVEWLIGTARIEALP